jgi:hypothetical protein
MTVSAWMPGNQVANLPTATLQFWNAQNLSLGVLARVNDTTYKIFGVPGAVPGALVASVVSAEYTSTHSIFTLLAGTTTFTIDFLSPVSPKNFLRQSLPFSYMTVCVTRPTGTSIQIYSDLDESWTGQTTNTVSDFKISESTYVFQLGVDGAEDYVESTGGKSFLCFIILYHDI